MDMSPVPQRRILRFQRTSLHPPETARWVLARPQTNEPHGTATLHQMFVARRLRPWRHFRKLVVRRWRGRKRWRPLPVPTPHSGYLVFNMHTGVHAGGKWVVWKMPRRRTAHPNGVVGEFCLHCCVPDHARATAPAQASKTLRESLARCRSGHDNHHQFCKCSCCLFEHFDFLFIVR